MSRWKNWAVFIAIPGFALAALGGANAGVVHASNVAAPRVHIAWHPTRHTADALEPAFDPQYDSQLTELLLARWPNHYSADEQAATGLTRDLLRIRIAAKTMPDLGFLALGDSTEIDWRVDRAFASGGDTRWVHFAPASLGEATELPPGFAVNAQEYCGFPPYPDDPAADPCRRNEIGLNGDAESWVLFYGDGTQATDSIVDCGSYPGLCGDPVLFWQNVNLFWGTANAAGTSFTLKPRPDDPRTAIRVMPPAQMWTLVDPDAFEVFGAQPVTATTAWTVPDPIDLATAREVMQTTPAARQWIDNELTSGPAPGNPTLTLSATGPSAPFTGQSEGFALHLGGVSAVSATPVTVTVTGANAGTSSHTLTGTDVSFSYTGTQPGTDTVTASATIAGQLVTSNAVTVTWLVRPAPTPCPSGGHFEFPTRRYENEDIEAPYRLYLPLPWRFWLHGDLTSHCRPPWNLFEFTTQSDTSAFGSFYGSYQFHFVLSVGNAQNQFTNLASWDTTGGHSWSKAAFAGSFQVPWQQPESFGLPTQVRLIFWVERVDDGGARELLPFARFNNWFIPVSLGIWQTVTEPIVR